MKKQALLTKKITLLQEKKRRLLAQVGQGYVPHPKQMAFHTAGKQAQERLFLAGNRCGKTLAGTLEMLFHLTGEYPKWWKGVRFHHPVEAWAASVTTEATRDILQATYMQHLPPEVVGHITHKRGVAKAIDTVKIRHVSGGWSVLGFKSYDQGREKFQGTARHLIHLDEEPEIGIYEECLMRTMTTHGHILLTMTPLLGMTDLCQRFLETEARAQASRAVIRASWEDAAHLDTATKHRLTQSLRPHEIQARRDGIPMLGQGKVFPINEDELKTPRFDIPDHFRLAYGLDFGWSNPTAAVLGAYDDATATLYLIDTYYHSELPPAEHAAGLRKFGDRIPGVCDPSGQSAHPTDGQNLIEMYSRHGLFMNKADNSVESGLMTMLEMMRAGKLKVFEDLDPWWQEFRIYRRGKGGKIVKQNDHLMDATRYLITSGLTYATTPKLPAKPFRRDSDWRTV